jgi:hypothetical protein
MAEVKKLSAHFSPSLAVTYLQLILRNSDKNAVCSCEIAGHEHAVV